MIWNTHKTIINFLSKGFFRLIRLNVKQGGLGKQDTLGEGSILGRQEGSCTSGTGRRQCSQRCRMLISTSIRQDMDWKGNGRIKLHFRVSDGIYSVRNNHGRFNGTILCAVLVLILSGQNANGFGHERQVGSTIIVQFVECLKEGTPTSLGGHIEFSPERTFHHTDCVKFHSQVAAAGRGLFLDGFLKQFRKAFLS